MAGVDFRGLLLICLFNLTLNKKSSSHSLQFVLKYHVFLDSLRVQIREHTHHSSGLAKYHVFLNSLRPQIREHTHRNFGLAALYYTGVELKKCNTHTQNRETTQNRESNYRGHSNPVDRQVEWANSTIQ